jgi:S-adenosylmethionine synthetase
VAATFAAHSMWFRPNPLNEYGRTKLAGEQAWKAALGEHHCAAARVISCASAAAGDGGCVLRVPVLYGDVETLAESAVTVIFEGVLKAVNGKQEQKMDHWATRYPTHVDDVARVMLALAEKRLGGIHHFSGAFRQHELFVVHPT